MRIEGPRFVIGRKDSCHMVLKDGWVSREHTLIIEARPGEYHVHDLESENGTYVNGERIREHAIKHGDLLRVGRTEMRFVIHSSEGSNRAPGSSTAVGANGPIGPGAVPPEYLAPARETPPRVDLTQTVADSRAANPLSDIPRIDLRERVRRLEARLNELEQENAVLAAENTVLNRNLARLGLLDRSTGKVDVSRMTPPPRAVVPEVLLPLISNSASRIVFPTAGGVLLGPDQGQATGCPAGVFRTGILGVDSGGLRLAEAFARIGYQRTVAVVSEREAMRGGYVEPDWRVFVDCPEDRRSGVEQALVAVNPRLDEAFISAFAGNCDFVLICTDLGSPLSGEGVAWLAGLLLNLRVKVAALVAIDDPERMRDANRLARVQSSFLALRSAADAGTLSAVIGVERNRMVAAGSDAVRSMDDSVAGVCDAALRLPIMPGLVGDWDVAQVRQCLLGGGFATLGRAATTDVTPEGLAACVSFALDGGLFAGFMPASRARSAMVLGLVGSEILAKEPASAGRLESAMERLSGDLPQARRLHGVYQDAGKWARVMAFLGGLPFPETLATERARRR